MPTQLASDYDQYGGLWYFAEPYHQQYLAKPGARPYCSAQPQGVSLAPFEEWCPKDLLEKYKPTLPETFWKKHGPVRGCSVVRFDNVYVHKSHEYIMFVYRAGGLLYMY